MTIDNHIKHGTQVAKGASYLFLQGAVANVTNLLFLTIATRLLSISNIGAVSALGLVGTFFVTIGTFAIPSAAIKYISEYMGKNEQSTAKEIYLKTLQFGFLASVAVSFSCFALSAIISQFVIGDLSLQPIITVLAFDVCALVFNSFLSGVLLGVQKFRLIAFVGVTVSILKLLFSLTLLALGLHLLGVVISWFAAGFIGVLLSLFFASSSFKQLKSSQNFPLTKLLRFSLPLYGASIIAYLSITVDKLVILSFSNLEVLGIYSIAVAAVNAIGIVPTSMGSSLFPKLAQIRGQYGENALKSASSRSSKYVFLINVPLATGLAAVAYPTIRLFFGESYASGWLSLTIISLVAAALSANTIITNILMSLGNTQAILKANILAVTIGASLCALLVTSQGSLGAALGRASLMLAAFAYAAYSLRSSFGLHLDTNSFAKSIVCSAVMVIAVVFSQLFLNKDYMLPLHIVIGALVYILMLRALKVVDRQDVQLFTQILPKRFHRFINLLARFFTPED